MSFSNRQQSGAAISASDEGVTIATGVTSIDFVGTTRTATAVGGAVTDTVSASGGSGDVTAASAFGTDNLLVRSDGTGKGVQASGIGVDDSDNLTGVGTVNTLNLPSSDFSGVSDAETLTNKTIDGDNNTISNLDIGVEVDWAAAANVPDRTAFASGDKLLIFEDGVGLRKIDYDDLPSGGGGISNVVEDTTPQLGGMLDVNGQAIGDGTRELITFTEDASAVNHINIENEATGSGPKISAAGDDTNIALKLMGKGSSTVEIWSSENNEIAKFDYSGSDVNYWNFTASDTGNPLVMGAAGDDTNIDIDISPKGTGNVIAGNFTFDGDQTVGAGQDNYVLTYDHSGGTIGLEAGGSGAESVNSEAAGSATLVTGEMSTGSGSIFNIVTSNAASQTITLPTTSGSEVGKWFKIYNAGTNRMTISSSDTLNGDSEILAAGAGCVAFCNASGEYTLIGTGNERAEVQFAVTEWTTDTATGDGQYYWRVPEKFNGWEITGVYANVITAGTTGTTDIQFHNVTDTVDILSTKLTIDSGETTSTTAATAAVINASNDELATNDIIRTDVDAVSTTAAEGLLVGLVLQPK